MNADTPSSASVTTWNVTSRRLCRLTIHLGADERLEFVAEAFAAEALRVCADRRAVPPMRHRVAERGGERRRRRLVDKDPGRARDDAFDRPSARVRYHRTRAGLR